MVTGAALAQRHAAGPPPGSDHRHFVVRGAGQPRMERRCPDRKEVIQPQGQQAASAPDQAGEQRPEDRRQRAQAGDGDPPDAAGEQQHRDAAPEPPRLRERQQAHAAQHQQQPARRRWGRVRARVRGPPRPGPPPRPQQEVPQVTAGGQRQQPPGAARTRAGAPLGPGQEAASAAGRLRQPSSRARRPAAPRGQRRPGRRGRGAPGRSGLRAAAAGGRPAAAAPRCRSGRGGRRSRAEGPAARGSRSSSRSRSSGSRGASRPRPPVAAAGTAWFWRLARPSSWPGWPRGSARPARTAASSSRSRTTPPPPRRTRDRGAPRLAARQSCARRRGPGSPPLGMRSGRVRLMLAGASGGRGLSPTPLRSPSPFSSGTSGDWRLGVASQLPLPATVTSRPQPGPLGARAAGGRSSPAAAPAGRAPRPPSARARVRPRQHPSPPVAYRDARSRPRRNGRVPMKERAIAVTENHQRNVTLD
ncbi:translation initiation factor IF-2-like [Ochotona curzoniae]|uniref:translation initiation factor IF-2-like n=1 Tax=Ochotona curzoniae TaxID=130825 RepID=UPI001B34A396|nr:translation initiation factor IF-2-like [Ochotona curzoniae]